MEKKYLTEKDMHILHALLVVKNRFQFKSSNNMFLHVFPPFSEYKFKASLSARLPCQHLNRPGFWCLLCWGLRLPSGQAVHWRCSLSCWRRTRFWPSAFLSVTGWQLAADWYYKTPQNYCWKIKALSSICFSVQSHESEWSTFEARCHISNAREKRMEQFTLHAL